MAAALLKWGSLLLFLCQNTLNPVVFRYATTETTSSARASTSVILFVTESLKLILSFGLLIVEEGSSLNAAGAIVYNQWLKKPRASMVLGLPALIYALQNALLQWSAGNLPAALWQVTYQGKILVVAGLSVVLLRKEIKRVQWFAIAIMGLGIAVVQLSNAKEKKQDSMANASEQNFLKGFIMLLLACFCSGFAGVYTEMIFKQVGAAKAEIKVSLWLQNMQLAVFSMLLMVVTFLPETMLVSTSSRQTQHVFEGFTGKTWALAVNNAIGGLFVAMVIKYADNILRGFASALATINACILAVFCFGFVIGGRFVLGVALVIGSTLLYGGVVKLPGEWWNSECELCKPPPTPDPAIATEFSQTVRDKNAVQSKDDRELVSILGAEQESQQSDGV